VVYVFTHPDTPEQNLEALIPLPICNINGARGYALTDAQWLELHTLFLSALRDHGVPFKIKFTRVPMTPL
jgi:hypothetical protein